MYDFIMKKKLPQLIIITIGGLLTVFALFLAWKYYGWHLSLILFLAFVGNNLERIKLKEKPGNYQTDEIKSLEHDFRNV